MGRYGHHIHSNNSIKMDMMNHVKIPLGSFYCPKNVTGSRGAVDPGMPANAIGFLERNRSGVARGTCFDLME